MTKTLSLRDSPHYFRVLALFVATSLVAIFATTAMLSSYLANYMTGQMMMRDAQVSMEFLNSIVRVEHATSYFLGEPSDGENVADTKELIVHVSRLPDVFRANVYGRDRSILWSSDPELIGRVFEDNDELEAAMTGELHPEIFVVDRGDKAEHVGLPENVEEFIEYYIPIWSADQTFVVGAVEVYKAPASLLASIRRVVELSRLGAVIAGAVLFSGLLLVVLYSTRILRRQEARLIETERLAVVGEMASAVAHGLRNPLAAIRSCAELMAEDDLPAHSRDTVQDIVDQVERLESWIRSFLVRARSDPGKAADSAQIDVIVLRCLRSFDSQIKKRGITVETTPSEGSPVANGGSSEVEQVLNTILSNAIEAMPQGGTIRIGWSAAPGRRVSITVRDSGPGLTDQQLQSLFRPFQTSKASGLGVGLALGRRIAERLGGSLELRNGAERGVEATLTLPARG